MRAGQEVVITTLGNVLEHEVDMQTIIIVGNSRTYVYGPYMVTPRGYLGKYKVSSEQ
jgi:precorrin-3B C17-methyltransferase